MKIEIILYVADQQRSRDFYANVLGIQPELDVPGMTGFRLTDDLRLGLMPEDGIAKILADKTPHPSGGNGIPRCELYLNTENFKELFGNALLYGAKEVSSIQERSWGEKAGYVADPDGHIIAFAEGR